MTAICPICPHFCRLNVGDTGLCRARRNENGSVIAINYGRVTSLALDPIEKKPLYHFFPGSHILSVGSFGCNLRCPFCQNHEISAAGEGDIPARHIAPDELASLAAELVPQGNIGAAYTYNEPLVGYEYVRDCSAAVRERGLKNVLVTAGYINPGPLEDLLPLIDAMNIDLKCFTEDGYKKLGGGLETVLGTIRAAARLCHVEVTTLIVPGLNDSEDEIRSLSSWLAGLDPAIPYHLSRFFPRYKMSGALPTPVATVRRLAGVASEKLRHVYCGNC